MREQRLFTLEEAERTLPLVRRIVEDIQREYPEWRDAMQTYELAAAGVRAEWGESEDLVRHREIVSERARHIHGFLRELESIGCLLKGFESGIVDFYTLRGDRLVFYCWRLGEDRITHWHEVEGGFDGRQPIDESLLTGVHA